MAGTERPVLVFDGDCAFCTTCAQFAEKRMKRHPMIVAWQFADLDELGLAQAQCEEAVQWVASDGAIASGHLAISALLMHAGRLWWPLGAVLRVPGISWLASVVYRWIATNRHRMPGGTAACSLPQAERDARR